MLARGLGVALVLLGFAISTVVATEPVFQNKKGIAVDGHDVVAYFEIGSPTKGRATYTHEWNGAVWWFSSEVHRELFVTSPEKYAPRYGGYCAWAVGNNDIARSDPRAWKIVDGKLYLNYSKKIQAKWEADMERLIRQADENWPGLLD